MARFKIGIGQFWHESNGFSSRETTLDDFVSYQGFDVGREVLEHPGRQDEVSGFVQVLSASSDVEIFPLVSFRVLPSGPIADDTVGHLEKTLRRQLRKAGRLDGICFAFHGAISGSTIVDLDGYFLKVLREEAGSKVPIVVALDCHAIVTQQMVDLSTALVAYRTHPHRDLVETGGRAMQILLDTLRKKIAPVIHYQKVPMMLPPPDEGTHSGALKELFETFVGWDSIDGVIACSLCPSFAWQDVPEQGWAAIAVTNNDCKLGGRLVRRLAEQAWAARNRLLPEPMLSPHDAVHQAISVKGGPVIITDSADTTGGGALGDTTTLLRVLLEVRDQVKGLILTHLPDPDAVVELRSIGAGRTVSIAVGGKRDTRFSQPVTVRGQILRVTEGPITDDGQFGSEPMIDAGTIVSLAVDNVCLVLSENPINGPQPSLFRKVGIEPYKARIVALKTGIGYTVTYGQVAKAVIRADCPGAVSYNLSNFDFRRIPRPMFPLGPDIAWQPG